MLAEYIKILEINQYQKFDKIPFIIYADLKSLIEKMDGCKNNPKISFSTKKVKIFKSIFQYLQYRLLETLKLITVVTEVNIS